MTSDESTSIQDCIEATMRLTGVLKRFASVFETILDFADITIARLYHYLSLTYNTYQNSQYSITSGNVSDSVLALFILLTNHIN